MAHSAETPAQTKNAERLRRRDLLPGWLLSAVCGIALWGLCRAIGDFLGFCAAFSPLALIVCTVLGLPGAVALLLARGIFLFL
jgi:hypothetical protein